MQEDLKAELGPEVGDLDLRSLHPRTFVEKHLFGDEEDPLGLDALTKDFNGTNDPKPVVESRVANRPSSNGPGVRQLSRRKHTPGFRSTSPRRWLRRERGSVA